ncbi:MAG TPA: trehalose-6-phosphate synthase [Gemmatimonadales bacterium]|nr:trehalose-6-phosphate synthase [Gemmatimonadales bacterium]
MPTATTTGRARSRSRRSTREPLILLSNREPFEHNRGGDGELSITRPAGGLTSALQPLMASRGGTWVAWGSGSADFDVTDDGDTVRVPPERPRYRLRRIRLTPEEVQAYYVESANRALWPLCHLQLNHFAFDYRAWQVYRQVNHRFARAALEEARDGHATVWVHDYHLSYVAGAIRRLRGGGIPFVHQFWHIPWPPADILRALPVARRVLRGLLGNDLLEFQTGRYVLNFLTSVADLLPGARVDLERSTVRYDGRVTVVRAYPISIDVAAWERRAAQRGVVEAAQRLRRRHAPGGAELVLGVDRIDYSKGIPQRLEAFARLLQESPAWRGKVTFLQIATPSRSEIPAYQELEREVIETAATINARYGTPEWVPVVLLRENADADTLAACYRAADVCIVSSLQDGMNLVAKEFIACQRGGRGVLVLSRFAGAAEEMDGALLINPYDVGASARALETALGMGERERKLRLQAMRRQLKANTIRDWMRAIFDDVDRLRRKSR